MSSNRTNEQLGTCLGCMIGIGLAWLIDFLVVCGLYWLCCWAFSFQFNWRYAVAGSVVFIFLFGCLKQIAKSARSVK